MTEEQESIRAGATGRAIATVATLGIPGLESTGIRYGYGVMPVGFLAIVIFTVGEAAYRLYKWLNN